MRVTGGSREDVSEIDSSCGLKGGSGEGGSYLVESSSGGLGIELVSKSSTVGSCIDFLLREEKKVGRLFNRLFSDFIFFLEIGTDLVNEISLSSCICG